MEKGILSFTIDGNFKQFDNSVKKYIVKNKIKKNIRIIDYIYPVTKLTKDIYEITDHVNLSGTNPLIGPNFISLTDIYNSKKSKEGIVVAGIRRDIHLNNHERKILLKANIKAYCYNLIPAAIYAASLGMKIIAIGIVCHEKYTSYSCNS